MFIPLSLESRRMYQSLREAAASRRIRMAAYTAAGRCGRLLIRIKTQPTPIRYAALDRVRRRGQHGAPHREGLSWREGAAGQRLLRRADIARQGELPYHRPLDVARAELRQGVRLREEGMRAREQGPRRS